MTNNPKQQFTILKNLLLTGLVTIVAAMLMGASLFSDSDRIGERQIETVIKTFIMKDNQRAEVKYEKLVRTYTRAAFLSGINQPSTKVYSYTVLTVTIKKRFGWDKVYRWIDNYPLDSVYFTKVDSLVLTDKDVFIKYFYIPAFPVDDRLHYRERSDAYKYESPFKGDPRLVIKYARYKGSGSLRQDNDEMNREIHVETYKWPDRYIWDDVNEEEFNEGVQSGDVISLDDINSNGKFEFYSTQTRPDESIVYYGKRNGNEKEIDYYDYYRKRIVRDHELRRFLSAVKSGQAVIVGEMLNNNPQLIHSHDPDGMTSLHLALLSGDKYNLLPLLFKFKPEINVIDYKGRTPLQMALFYHANKTIVVDLKKMGGKVLWSDCKGGSYRLNIKQEISLAKNTNQNQSKGNWLGEDVYQVWVESDRSRMHEHGYDSRQDALFTGRQIIINELGLSGAAGSEQSRKIDLILDNAHVACSTLDKSKHSISDFLVRISAPNLRMLVKQYKN